jgi:hypothetical protein
MYFFIIDIFLTKSFVTLKILNSLKNYMKLYNNFSDVIKLNFL